MGHTTHYEFVWQVVKAVCVHPDQTKLPQQLRLFEIGQGRSEFGHKERIIGR